MTALWIYLIGFLITLVITVYIFKTDKDYVNHGELKYLLIIPGFWFMFVPWRLYGITCDGLVRWFNKNKD